MFKLKVQDLMDLNYILSKIIYKYIKKINLSYQIILDIFGI